MQSFLAFRWQFLLLMLFCCGIVLLWMLPVLLMGYPPFLPAVASTRAYVETGSLAMSSSVPLTLFLSLWHEILAWREVVGWTAIHAALMGMSVAVLWFLVRALFGSAVAWASIVVYALMPEYWVEALSSSGYPLALLSVFLSALAFVALRVSRPYGALALSGALLGFAVSAADAFVLFVPWACAVLFWMRRRTWKSALAAVLVFGMFSIAGYIAPPIVPVVRHDGTLRDRVALFVTLTRPQDPGVNHVYPDDYTYLFDREAFDAAMRERFSEATFLERRKSETHLLLFGIQDMSILARIRSGTWVFLQQIPTFFQIDIVGGAFLWLFLLPGIAAVWRRQKVLLWMSLSLFLWMEFALRYVILFNRSHLSDVAWLMAIGVGVGVATVTEALAATWPTVRRHILMTCTVAIIAVQLTSASRHRLAVHYEQSPVPQALAAEPALSTLPEGAVVAHPRQFALFAFVSVSHVNIHPETIERHIASGDLSKPFRHYGVTHIVGYSSEQTARIRSAVPTIEVLMLDAVPPPSPTPLVRYLLHLVR